MKLFENGVGRPTNEIKKKRKIFIISTATLIVLMVVGSVLFFNKNSNDLKGNSSIGVTNFYIENSSHTILLNKTKTKKLYLGGSYKAKDVNWTSLDKKVATVDKNGVVTAKKVGETKIIIEDKKSKKKIEFPIFVKKKIVVFITASLGKRMDCWFHDYENSSSGVKYTAQPRNCEVKDNIIYSNYKEGKKAYDSFGYNKNDSLFYIYDSGSPSSFQYSKIIKKNEKEEKGGLEIVKDIFNKIYDSKKQRKYVELSVFFTLSGNGVKTKTCDQIESPDNKTYTTYAKGYNLAIKTLKSLGYTNTKGYVLSHSPLNTIHIINEFPNKAKSNKIVYSKDENACSKGYRSAYKYYLSNEKMEDIIKNTKTKDGNRKYANLTFINYSEKIVKIDNKKEKTFTWQKNKNGVSYDKLIKTHDGLHWDEDTTNIIMPIILKEAGL